MPKPNAKIMFKTPEAIAANDILLLTFIEAAARLTGRYAEDDVFTDLLNLGMKTLDLSPQDMSSITDKPQAKISQWKKCQNLPAHIHRPPVIIKLLRIARGRLGDGPT